MNNAVSEQSKPNKAPGKFESLPPPISVRFVQRPYPRFEITSGILKKVALFVFTFRYKKAFCLKIINDESSL